MARFCGQAPWNFEIGNEKPVGVLLADQHFFGPRLHRFAKKRQQAGSTGDVRSRLRQAQHPTQHQVTDKRQPVLLLAFLRQRLTEE